MDYKDYLSKIQEDVNQRTKDILDYSQKRVDSIIGKTQINDETQGKPDKLDRLIKDNRLELATQAKIGTFEKLYLSNYLGDSRVPMYGYDDLDYASLVNLLASALEIELNMSIYQAIREQNGIPLPEYAFKNAPNQVIKINKLEINLGKAKQMYGALIELCNQFYDTLGRFFDKPSEFLDSLAKIAKIRNDANHTVQIDKEAFWYFYKMYAKLFNSSIYILLNYKETLKSQIRQQYASAYTYAGSYDSSEDDYIRSIGKGLTVNKDVTRGIIFTDSRQLSIKYEGTIAMAGQIHDVLLGYANKLSAFGVNYHILDLADGYYDRSLHEHKDWQSYLTILDDVCMKSGIDGDHPAALFIIGGDDVIPMPQLHNPISTPTDEAEGQDFLDSTVDSDLPYAYRSDAIKLTAKGDLSLDALQYDIMKPRLFVGRLPLESGFVKTRIDKDLYSYLLRALSAYEEGGISVEYPLMTTMRRTIRVGSMMKERIPVKSPDDLPDDMIAEDMLTSPSICITDSPKRGVKECRLQEYQKVLSSADMLLFLLHGGCHPASGVYSGEYINKDGNHIFPAAFSPELLHYGTFKCIATVSCFGAKFIGYDRGFSTLLSAIYKDSLSFMGSSRSSPGIFDDTIGQSNWEMYLASVRLMNLYLGYLFSGMQGAEALTRARLQYFSEFTSWRNSFATCRGVTTMLEFNYFGDPALWLKPKISAPSGNTYQVKYAGNEQINGDRWLINYDVVSEAKKPQGLLARLRAMVDKNFEDIHARISKQLYKEYGLDPREFYKACKYSSKGGDAGYSLLYRHADGEMITDTYVDVDAHGNINGIYGMY